MSVSETRLSSSTGRLLWRADTVRIDRERILHGLSQEQLARAAQVDPGTLSDLLNGRRRPQLATMGAIARALQLALPDLVTFE
jgi:transcriptional regulator with XRE-family HTH domain